MVGCNITGRVKDTFKTAKAEFIVPSEIEKEFSVSNDIEQLCLLGLGMPQPVLMVVPSEIGTAKPKEELMKSYEETVKAVNAKLANYRKMAP